VADRGVTFPDLAYPLFVATTPAPSRPLPDLTPAPALLRALADVGEVELTKGLGRRRLAEVARYTGPIESARRERRPRLGWLLLALVVLALLLAFG
jgi:hypothetical protein